MNAKDAGVTPVYVHKVEDPNKKAVGVVKATAGGAASTTAQTTAAQKGRGGGGYTRYGESTTVSPTTTTTPTTTATTPTTTSTTPTTKSTTPTTTTKTKTTTKKSSSPKINIPKATDQSAYIKQMYQQALDAQQAQLQAAYEQQMANLDYQAGKIPGMYNAAADQAAVQNEINKMNFNNMAAGTGLNTGAMGQAALSQANALQRDITAVRQAQADAQEQLELERQQQQAAYQQAIAQAIAENNRDRAQALYQEAIRQDQAAQQRAQILSQYKYNVWAANRK